MEGPEMGKKSVKEDKNIYFRSREAAGLTRAEASEKTFISESRIEKIEYNNGVPRPDEVIAMAHAYNAAHLCNYYCSHDCQIGQKYVPEVRIKDLSQIGAVHMKITEELVVFDATAAAVGRFDRGKHTVYRSLLGV